MEKVGRGLYGFINKASGVEGLFRKIEGSKVRICCVSVETGEEKNHRRY